MRFKINNHYFNKAISDVSKAVSLRTPFPILSGIKITASLNGLMLIGSNSDIVIQKFIPSINNGEKIIEIDEVGSVVVAAKYLSEIVKKLQSQIHFSANEKQVVTLRSDDVKMTFIALNAEEYPSLPQIDENQRIKIPIIQLLELIKQTSFAVSKSETKPVLTGVNISLKENSLSFVATNSHRLAFRKLSIVSRANGSVIVPGTSLNELMKLMNDESNEISVYISSNYIVFKSDTVSLYSRIIEGNYPNISGLFPKESKTVITINRNQFLKGIDRACLFASGLKNNNVQLDILEGTKIRISSPSTEIGKIEEIQELERLDGENDLTISLDGIFLIDALRAIKEEEITISFGGPMKPVLIQPTNNMSFYQLISPVRTY